MQQQQQQQPPPPEQRLVPRTNSNAGGGGTKKSVPDDRIRVSERRQLCQSSAVSSDLPSPIVRVPGDKLRLKIRHQDRTLNDKTVIFKRSRLKYFLFVGSRRPAGGWPKGAYEIEVTLERERGRPGRVGVQRYLASTVVSE